MAGLPEYFQVSFRGKEAGSFHLRGRNPPLEYRIVPQVYKELDLSGNNHFKKVTIYPSNHITSNSLVNLAKLVQFRRPPFLTYETQNQIYSSSAGFGTYASGLPAKHRVRNSGIGRYYH
jgi:hypothetical protein